MLIMRTSAYFTQNPFISKSLIVAFAALLMTLQPSCTKDFEAINTNPHGFTTASDGSLFNSVIASLVPTGNELFYIQNEILYKQTQQAALTREAWGNFTLGTEDMWKNYYATLPEIRELEKRFASYDTGAPLRNMQAMLRISRLRMGWVSCPESASTIAARAATRQT